MFKKLKEKRARAKEVERAIHRKPYLVRLSNSCHGFCGARHSGGGPYLTMSEINGILWSELARRTREQDRQNNEGDLVDKS